MPSGAFLVVIAVGRRVRGAQPRLPRPCRSRGPPRAEGPAAAIRLGTTELGLLALALGGLGVFALAALSYRGIPWTSTGAGFLLSAGAIIVAGLIATMALAAAMLAAEEPDRGPASG